MSSVICMNDGTRVPYDCRAKCKKYDQQSVMEATLEKLEAPVATLPGSPEDTSMQDASTPPMETPSQTLGFQLAHAGLDSVSGVSNCTAISCTIPACSSSANAASFSPS